jgi:hypothetical protein
LTPSQSFDRKLPIKRSFQLPFISLKLSRNLRDIRDARSKSQIFSFHHPASTARRHFLRLWRGVCGSFRHNAITAPAGCEDDGVKTTPGELPEISALH